MFVVAGSSLFIVQSGSLRVTVEKEGACRQLATFEKGANARSLSVLARISKFPLSRMVGVHIYMLVRLTAVSTRLAEEDEFSLTSTLLNSYA